MARVLVVALALLALGGAAFLTTGGPSPAPPALTQDSSSEGPSGTLRPAAGSWVGYRVRETVGGIGVRTAVGRTAGVRGSATVQDGRIERADLEVDMESLRSAECGRDAALRTRGIETDRFPRARFVLTAPVAVARRFEARGRLTLHGVTRPVRMALEAGRSAERLELAGSLPIRFADYGMTPPSVAGVASVRSEGILEVRLLLKR